MIRIYITRHGETEWNVQKRMQGWNDSDLTEKGIQHAKALGKRLDNINFECIYCSPSGRAVHTAELIKGNRDIRIIQDDNLKEIHLGEWEGKNSMEVEEFDKEALQLFWNKPHLYVPKSGESFFDVRERISSVLKKINEDTVSGEILIVTHAVVVKTIMSIFKNLDVTKLWEKPFIHGASLSIVEIADKKANVVLEGDLSHIAKL